MDVPAPSTRFETEIARYNRWREELTQSVHAYHDWLESNKQLDVQQSIRFYDLLENLNKGRLMLAFLAEFSRGKSELINALFFSSFKERLLPSDVGRTTMCPTEIFHDPSEEPYLKLLSVETRYRDESISQLKNMPVEWSKIRLNINSAKDMKQALKALADTKKVYALEARMLGLSPMLNEKGEAPGEEELVEVPAWRYAMINYPHPLLSNGLSILDTPGLNALGMEPELTVSTVPNAHAILFLLSIDTGVTKSDLEIWERYVRSGLPQKVAVLNKIDLMWDELKTQEEVDRAIKRMVESTGQHLNLPLDRIFAISAQKALLAKIKGDEALLEKSGIDDLERYMAESIVPMKRQILCRAVVNEIGGMMNSSRALLAKRQQSNQAEIAELQGLVGKSRDMVTKLWAKITAEKNAYNAALAEYKVNHGQFSAKRTALLDMLNPAKLDAMLAKNQQSMNDSWVTVALQRAMRDLTQEMCDDFERAFVASEDIKKLMQGVYNTFISKFGFQKMKLPSLDLDPHRTKLKLLVHETDAFAKDPVNVISQPKGPFVKKFYNTLVKQARATFLDAKNQSERWMQAVVLPLEVQMKDHKAALQTRLDSLSKINEKTSSINEQMAILRKAEAELRAQRDMIEGLLARVSEYAAAASLESDLPETVNLPAEKAMQVFGTGLSPTGTTTQRPVQPLVSDDFMAQLAPGGAAKAAQPAAAAGFDPNATQKLPENHDRTQKLPDGHDRTQKLPEGHDRTAKLNPGDTQRLDVKGPQSTQRLDIPAGPQSTQPIGPRPTPAAPEPPGERTMRIKALDPAFKPEATQILPGTAASAAPAAKDLSNAEVTQRLDDSIWRLQEAKRLLQKTQK
jgi:hypothetical protein